MTVKGKTFAVDKCIYDLVELLNNNGFETEASCCGHGNVAGWIPLKDGRQIMITDFGSARKFIESFGVTITGEKVK